MKILIVWVSLFTVIFRSWNSDLNLLSIKNDHCYKISSKHSIRKIRFQFDFFVGLERYDARKYKIGYVDEEGRQHKIHLDRNGLSLVAIKSDSVSFFLQTDEFMFATDKLHCKFLKNGGLITFGIIPNYDSVRSMFEADPDLQLSVMNESETVYSLLTKQAVIDRFRQETIFNRNKLVYVSVKQKSLSTGGIYYKYDFLN